MLKLWFKLFLSPFTNIIEISEKDIPSQFLDEERYAKEASSSGAQVSIPLTVLSSYICKFFYLFVLRNGLFF